MTKTVSQEDRQTVVDILIGQWRQQHGSVVYGWMRDVESAVLSGKRDEEPIVQRVAHHAEQARLEERAKLRTDLRTISELVGDAFHGTIGATQALDAIDDVAKAAVGKD
jgi:hypothetical protein